MTADIDECWVNKGNCSVNATCNNTPCSYSCTCITGFQGDGFTCTGELSWFFKFLCVDVNFNRQFTVSHWRINYRIELYSIVKRYLLGGHSMHTASGALPVGLSVRLSVCPSGPYRLPTENEMKRFRNSLRKPISVGRSNQILVLKVNLRSM